MPYATSSNLAWAVGVTTAPRRTATLSESLESLKLAGWSEYRVFAEPETPLPAGLLAEGALTQHTETMGAFPNWYLGLTELYLRNPTATAYLICQDDISLVENCRGYLERVLWPAPEVGVVSLYCPSHQHREDHTGLITVDSGWDAWGALSYVFSNPGIRQFLSDLTVLNHRHHGPADGLRNIDSVVGSWCRRRRLPYFVHLPSLVQHLGETSTIWKRSRANGRRRAVGFQRNLAQKLLE